MWDMDIVKQEIELMAILDGMKDIDEDKKDSIRHKISMSVVEQVNT